MLRSLNVKRPQTTRGRAWSRLGWRPPRDGGARRVEAVMPPRHPPQDRQRAARPQPDRHRPGSILPRRGYHAAGGGTRLRGAVWRSVWQSGGGTRWTRGCSSVGQSRRLITARSQVRGLPAPRRSLLRECGDHSVGHSAPAGTAAPAVRWSAGPSRGRPLDLVRMGVGVQGLQLLPGRPAAGRDPLGGVGRRPAVVGAPAQAEPRPPNVRRG
jgi:hypothetical protein